MSTSVPPLHEELLLLTYPRVLERLSGKDVRVNVVTPPYPAIGSGELRVVRVSEEGAATVLDLSYEHYDRLQ